MRRAKVVPEPLQLLQQLESQEQLLQELKSQVDVKLYKELNSTKEQLLQELKSQEQLLKELKSQVDDLKENLRANNPSGTHDELMLKLQPNINKLTGKPIKVLSQIPKKTSTMRRVRSVRRTLSAPFYNDGRGTYNVGGKRSRKYRKSRKNRRHKTRHLRRNR